MRLVYSALVQDARGSLGGSVASTWRGIPYLRMKAQIITNTPSVRRAAVRGYFNNSAVGWRFLTPEQKAGWGEFAQSLRMPNNKDEDVGTGGIIPSLGRIMSGINAYIGINQTILASGGARITAAPLEQMKPPAIATNLVQYGVYSGAKIDFTVWLSETYAEQKPCQAQIWIKATWKYAHSYIAIVPAPGIEAPPGLATDVSISTIRVVEAGEVKEIPLPVPCEVWLQMRTICLDNGLVSRPSALYRVKVVS